MFLTYSSASGKIKKKVWHSILLDPVLIYTAAFHIISSLPAPLKTSGTTIATPFAGREVIWLCLVASAAGQFPFDAHQHTCMSYPGMLVERCPQALMEQRTQFLLVITLSFQSVTGKTISIFNRCSEFTDMCLSCVSCCCGKNTLTQATERERIYFWSNQGYRTLL